MIIALAECIRNKEVRIHYINLLSHYPIIGIQNEESIPHIVDSLIVQNISFDVITISTSICPLPLMML